MIEEISELAWFLWSSSAENRALPQEENAEVEEVKESRGLLDQVGKSFSCDRKTQDTVPDDLLRRILHWATIETRANATAVAWVDNKAEIQSQLSFHEFALCACGIAEHIKSFNFGQTNRRVMLLFMPGLDFKLAFIGCLIAGFIPIPMHPPNPRSPSSGMRKLLNCFEVAQPCLALTHDEFLRLKKLQSLNPKAPRYPKALRFSSVSKLCPASDLSLLQQAILLPDDRIVLLQFSSGSTGAPKAVAVQMRNLNSNLQSLVDHLGTDEFSRGVSFLPSTHDGGLIGAFLHNMYGGGTTHFFSPLDFIRNPSLWFKVMSKFKVHITTGMEFAFALMVSKVDLKDLDGVDLSSVTRFTSGGEPIKADTLRNFAQKFAPLGIKIEHLDPCFGLAENVLFVSSRRGLAPRKPLMVRFEADSLRIGLAAVAISTSTQGLTQELVGNGTVANGVEVIVAHPDTLKKLPENGVGELWVGGPSKARGYLTGPEKVDNSAFTARLTDSQECREFYRTGDIGFIFQGEVFICGRLKEMIIINGQNIFPHDVAKHIGDASNNVRKGCVAVFGKMDPSCATEQVVALVEVKSSKSDNGHLYQEALFIKNYVQKNVGVEISELHFLPPRTVPKTTSGKVRNVEAARLLQIGNIHSIFALGAVADRTENRLIPNVFTDPESICMKWLHHRVADLLNIDVSTFSETDDLRTLGLTSFIEVQVVNELVAMRKGFGLTMGTMPHSVKELVAFARDAPTNSSGTMEEIKQNLPILPVVSSIHLPLLVESILHFLGACLIFALVFVSVLPSYHFVYFLFWESDYGQPWVKIHLYEDVFQFGLLVPLVVPLWMITFTLCIIALKWVAIGRYRPCKIRMHSLLFFRWWVVDRGVDFWEFAVGYFIADTPITNIVLNLFGAQISMSAKLGKTSIREFDLVEIDKQARVEGMIFPRVFNARDQTLSMARVRIGTKAHVASFSTVVSGSWIADGVKVESNCVIPEGGITLPGATYRDARRIIHEHERSTKIDPQQETKWIQDLLIKTMMLFATLFIFFYLSTLGVVIYGEIGYSESFRYMPLLFWGSLFFLNGALITFVSITFKRLLFLFAKGELASFLVDLHFKIADLIFVQLFDGNQFALMLFRLYGAKIGKRTLMFTTFFNPSVDLIIGNDCFISLAGVEVQEGVSSATVIDDNVEIYLHSVVQQGVRVRNHVPAATTRRFFDVEGRRLQRISPANEEGAIDGLLKSLSDAATLDVSIIEDILARIDSSLIPEGFSLKPTTSDLRHVLEKIRASLGAISVVRNLVLRLLEIYGIPSETTKLKIVRALHWVLVINELSNHFIKGDRCFSALIALLRARISTIANGFRKSKILGVLAACIHLENPHHDEKNNDAIETEILAANIELAAFAESQTASRSHRGLAVAHVGRHLATEALKAKKIRSRLIRDYIVWNLGFLLGNTDEEEMIAASAILFMPDTMLSFDAKQFSYVRSFSLGVILSIEFGRSRPNADIAFLYESCMAASWSGIPRSSFKASPYPILEPIAKDLQTLPAVVDQFVQHIHTENNETAAAKESENIGLYLLELSMFFWRLVMLPFFLVASLIPSFEWAVLVLYGEPRFWATQERSPLIENRSLGIIFLFPSLILAMLGFAIVNWIHVRPLMNRGRSYDEENRLILPKSVYLMLLIPTVINETILLPMLHGTVFYNFWCWCMGARVHRTSYLSSRAIRDLAFLNIEENAVVDCGRVMGHSFHDGQLFGGESRVGRNSTVHPHAIIFNNVETSSEETLQHRSVAFRPFRRQ